MGPRLCVPAAGHRDFRCREWRSAVAWERLAYRRPRTGRDARPRRPSDCRLGCTRRVPSTGRRCGTRPGLCPDRRPRSARPLRLTRLSHKQQHPTDCWSAREVVGKAVLHRLLGRGRQVFKGIVSACGRVQPPLSAYALEHMSTAILEGNPGTVDQILDGARHEHLSRVGQGGNSCSDVHCDATDVVTARLALASVQSRFERRCPIPAGVQREWWRSEAHGSGRRTWPGTHRQCVL